MKNEKDYMVLKQTFHQHLISEEIFYKEHPKFLIQKHNTFLDALQGTIYEKKNHNFYREETNLFKYIIISFSKEVFDSRIMKRLQNVAEFFKHLLN